MAAQPREDPSRDFYKGLIQAAVAYYHGSRKNVPGGMSLFRASSCYLRQYRPIWCGVQVSRFLKAHVRVFRRVARAGAVYEARHVRVIARVGPRAGTRVERS